MSRRQDYDYLIKLLLIGDSGAFFEKTETYTTVDHFSSSRRTKSQESEISLRINHL